MGFVNWGTFLIQSINIAVIVWLLNKFVFKPYLAFLDTEEAKRQELETSHKNIAFIKDDADLEAKKILDTAKAEAKALRTQAEANAKAEASAIMANAKAEAEETIKKAHADMENERKQLQNELESHILQVALLLNEKLFGKNDANQAFIKESLVSLSK